MRSAVLLLAMAITGCVGTHPTSPSPEPPAGPGLATAADPAERSSAALAPGAGETRQEQPRGVGASPPSTATQEEGRGLEELEKWLSTELEVRHLQVAFEGAPIDLAAPSTIDIEYGHGHGGSLVLVRLTVGQENTVCERVSWEAYTEERDKAGRAERAQVPTSMVRGLLDAIRVLSRSKVTEPPRDDWGMTTSDFFVLVRVCGSGDAPDRVWQFAGYRSCRDEIRYVALEAVVALAVARLGKFHWGGIPVGGYRQTHFTDALVRNKEMLVEDFHWWVMERSIEALGWFGNKTALPAVAWVREHDPDLIERQVAKLRHVLEEPDTYLVGPPREVPED